MIRLLGILLSITVFLFPTAQAAGLDDELGPRAKAGLRKAVDYFDQQVSVEGGYLWHYTDDLKYREGEGQATATQAWVQPPGTPSVGTALLQVWERTGDSYYLERARHTAQALVRGQLRSGGWDYKLEFDPTKREAYAYRDGSSTNDKAKNVSTLDDNTTQSALLFLMQTDRALKFSDAKIHEAALYALDRLIEAQYPNGAWPQRFTGPPEKEKFPVLPASYPETWSRTWPNVNYTTYYTFNDRSMSDCIHVMFEATKIYGDLKYRQAAERCGDFILLAQLPEPQPAWAQQYDAQMHPAWARKFEPPSITGGESQSNLRTLMALYRQTGEKKYLEPIPRALAYFRRSLLPDGRLARFYELHTNRPLYFTTKYELTYKDDDLPTHYGFKIGSNLDALQKEYDQTLAQPPQPVMGVAAAPPSVARKRSPPSDGQRAGVKAVLAALDDQGRWLSEGKLKYQEVPDPSGKVIETELFMKNVLVLADYLRALRD